MTITTKYNIGDTAGSVSIEGADYTVKITEIRIHAYEQNPEVLTTYSGTATIWLTKPDGTKYESSRSWMGKEEDIA